MRTWLGDAYDVQTLLGSYFLIADSSSSVGAAVSWRSGDIWSAQPVSFLMFSMLTPGWFAASIISRVLASNENMPMLVITRFGPPPMRPLRERQSPPSPKPGDVM